MIDPKELMIGNNLVQGISKHNGISLPNGIEYKIVGLMPFTCYVVRPDENPATVEKWDEFSYSLLHPIPLTPEILERCGFMKADELNWNLYLDTDTNAEPHTRRHLSWHLNLRELELDMNRLCFMRIKDPSLHTLQNLLNCLNVKIDLK